MERKLCLLSDVKDGDAYDVVKCGDGTMKAWIYPSGEKVAPPSKPPSKPKPSSAAKSVTKKIRERMRK